MDFERKIPLEDLPTLVKCFQEHDRLVNEARLLSDAALAEKWEVTPQAIHKYRMKYIGRRYN